MPDRMRHVDPPRSRDFTQTGDAAIAYRRLGWSVIPCGADKRPLPRFKWKRYQIEPPPESRIRQWFAKRSGVNVAVVLGSVSGDLACRDFDSLDAWDYFAEAHPQLASGLPVVRTPRPGMHVYFTAATRIHAFDDGELRGESGICLLPPSIQACGTPYEWIRPPTDDILAVDPDLFARSFSGATERTERTERTDENKGGSVADATASVGETFERIPGDLATAIELTLPTRPGQRHRRLFDFCRALTLQR